MFRILSVGMVIGLELSSLAYAEAGTRTGSGGDAVVCRDSAGHIASVEAFDRVEARIVRGLLPKYDDCPGGYMAKIEAVMGRLAKFDPQRSARYLGQARAFESEAQFVEGASLKDIQDSNEDISFISTACQLEQAAIRRNDFLPGEKRFLVDKALWDRMDDNSKAALVMHETIYRELDGADSRKARYFNSLVSSTYFDQLSDVGYYQILKSLKMKAPGMVAHFLGFEVVADSIEIQENYDGSKPAVCAVSLRNNQVSLNGKTFNVEKGTVCVSDLTNPVFLAGTVLDYPMDLPELRAKVTGFMRFKYDGSIVRGWWGYTYWFLSLTVVEDGGAAVWNGVTLPLLKGDQVSFDPKTLKLGSVSFASPVTFQLGGRTLTSQEFRTNYELGDGNYNAWIKDDTVLIHGKPVTQSHAEYMYFNTNGTIRAIYVASDKKYELMGVDGKFHRYGPHCYRFVFDDQERVTDSSCDND